MVNLALLQASDWSAAHETDLLALLGRTIAVALFGLFLVLLVRGIVHRSRYRALEVLTDEDRQAVQQALAAAERRTVGEILPVVVERSDGHPAAKWLSATFVALVGTAFALPWLPWDRPALLVSWQLLFGALGYLCAWAVPGYRRAFVRPARAAEMADEQAFQEFYRHDLHRTEAATGVLLFVSLLEQRVVVLADEGIASRVQPEHWVRTDRAILAGIAAGSLREGLLAGIEEAGEVLAEHHPWQEGDRNEVPDRLIVRAE